MENLNVILFFLGMPCDIVKDFGAVLFIKVVCYALEPFYHLDFKKV